MATFIPGGGNAWTDFGQGLGKGLQQLAEIKMEQMQQRHKQHQTEQAWGAVPGIDKTLAHALALADPKDRNTILSAYLSNTPEQQQGQQQDGLANQMQGLQSNQQYQTDEQKALQQYFAEQQRQPSNSGQMQPGQQRQQPQPYSAQQAKQQQPMSQSQLMARAFETPATKWAREKEETRKQEFQLRQQTSTQQNIERRADKFIDQAVTNAGEAEQMKSAILRAKELIATGKTRAGVQGLLSSKFTNANAETRELEKIFSEIILLRGNMGKGVASRMKLQLAKEAKASLDQPKAAQLYILDNMLEDADKTINAVGIIDEIIDANGGEVPKGLNRIATQVYHNRYSGKNAQQNGQNPQQTMGQQQGGAPQEQPQQDENFLGQAIRTGVGAAARVGEGAITGLGNLAQAGGAAIDYIGKAGGYNPGAQEAIAKYSPLPTSDQVQKKLSQWTNGYTDPQSGTEQFLYDVASTFGSMFMPGAVGPKFVNALTKAGMTAEKAIKTGKIIIPFSGYIGSWKPLLKAAAAGEGISKIAEVAGAGNLVQAGLKMGTMMALGTKGVRARITEEAKEGFKKANLEFENVRENVKHDFGRLTALENQIKRQAHRYTEDELEMIQRAKAGMLMTKGTKNIEKVTNKFAGKSKIVPTTTYDMKVEDLMGQRKSFNTQYGETTTAPITREKYTAEAARPVLGQILKILDAPIARAAEKGGEKTIKAWQDYILARDKWAALHTHGNMTKMFTKWAESSHPFSAGHNWISTLFLGAKAGGGYALNSISKFKDLLGTKIGRTAYLDAIKAAEQGNYAAFGQHLSRLDREATRLGL